jgi:hypothetical protein
MLPCPSALPPPPLQVGDMQKLVEMTEVNSDLKNKLRHLLKLSPEKWDEVAQHAMAAVVPDFRWAGGGRLLLCLAE